MTTTPLDLDEQIARIRLAQEQSDKFHAEQRKLIAEAEKHNIDRWLAPLIAGVTMLGALTAAVASVIMLLRFTP
jgi:hypothetical protein